MHGIVTKLDRVFDFGPFDAYHAGYFFFRIRLRPHASDEYDTRIRKLLNPFSRVEIFWNRSDTFWDTCGRLNPMMFELGVQSLQSSQPRGYKTTWLLTKTCTCSIELYLRGVFSPDWAGWFDSYPNTCGRKNFYIRKEKYLDSKVSGYVLKGV